MRRCYLVAAGAQTGERDLHGAGTVLIAATLPWGIIEVLMGG